ncbi:hypothetical protein [Streptomyces sp. NPDC057794]|uniref:hypothetical protein n=1 Tax=Streptomyces sp. NPDC057794 TaxID=3346251 RepID=UPI0036A7F31D
MDAVAEAADDVRTAIDGWAGESGQRRLDVETALKARVRAGAGPQKWDKQAAEGDEP